MEEIKKGGFTPEKAEDLDHIRDKIERRISIAEGTLNEMIGRDNEIEAFVQGRISAFGDVLKLMGRKKMNLKEEITPLIKRDYDKLDSIYTRFINASDDLTLLLIEVAGKRGSIATRHILSKARENIEPSIKGIEKILYGEVE